MKSNIPTGKTYLGFVFTWIVLSFIVWLLSIALFFSGRWLIGSVVIVATIAGFVGHSRHVGRRAKQGIRRADDSQR